LYVHRSAYSVQAVAADEKLAALLNIDPGAPVLVGREVAYTSDGLPILVGVNHYRGDAYRFEAELYRARPN
jgi:GntR family transcriptional regulator